MGVEKPQKEIYQRAVKQLAVKPSQAVLIDDKEINLYYGNRAWLNTILYQNPQQVKDDLKKLGVKTS
jgi:HAD superfamily hydrolase (TIGR01509 family)